MHEKHLIFALWMVTQSLLRVKAKFTVKISPKGTQAQALHESLPLHCLASGCSEKVTFMWTAVQDRPVVGPKNYSFSSSSFQLRTDSTEDQVILCKATCGDKRAQDQKKILIYSFPSKPVISSKDSKTLRCTAHGVFPSERFKIEWFHGDKNMGKNTASPPEYGKVQNIYSEYTHREGSLRRNITCRVTLTMDTLSDFKIVQSDSVLDGPEFITVPNDTTVNIGGRLVLRCESDGKSAITWRKLGMNEVIKKRELIIERAAWSDAGTYECEASTTLGSLRSKVNVTIQVPPRNSTVLVYPSNQVMEFQNITIHCSTVSFPPASITLWRESDGRVFASPNGTFHFYNLRSEDNGTYLVNFTNELGYEIQTIEVLVMKDGPEFITVPNDTTVNIGGRLVLRCESDGKSEITWRKLGTNEVIKKRELIIERAAWSDAGTYECEASTTLGSLRSKVNVTIQVPPRNSTVIVYPSNQVMEFQNITIHCSTVSFPPASITLRRESDRRVFASPNGTFHFYNLRSEDNGIYLVNFTNELGYEIQTIEVLVMKEDISNTPTLVKAIVPTVSSLSLLAPAALLIRYLRRLKKSAGDIAMIAT